MSYSGYDIEVGDVTVTFLLKIGANMFDSCKRNYVNSLDLLILKLLFFYSFPLKI